MRKNPNNGGARCWARSDRGEDATPLGALRALQKTEADRCWPIIKASNIEAE
jgi:hypothetical protein